MTTVLQKLIGEALHLADRENALIAEIAALNDELHKSALDRVRAGQLRDPREDSVSAKESELETLRIARLQLTEKIESARADEAATEDAARNKAFRAQAAKVLKSSERVQAAADELIAALAENDQEFDALAQIGARQAINFHRWPNRIAGIFPWNFVETIVNGARGGTARRLPDLDGQFLQNVQPSAPQPARATTAPAPVAGERGTQVIRLASEGMRAA